MNKKELLEVIGYLKSNPEIIWNPYAVYDRKVDYLLYSLEPDYDYLENYSKIEDKSIETMTMDELKTMYTWLLRGERFCDGHIASHIEDGMILKLAERHLELLEDRNQQ